MSLRSPSGRVTVTIGRRCERGKVQRHEAEAVGFKADGDAGMGDRDGRIRVARGRDAKGDHRRHRPRLGADIQAAGQAERAEPRRWHRRPQRGRREAARAVDGLKAAGRMPSPHQPAVAMAGSGEQSRSASANPDCFGKIDRIVPERTRPAVSSGSGACRTAARAAGACTPGAVGAALMRQGLR
jgi:hypothetical protein